MLSSCRAPAERLGDILPCFQPVEAEIHRWPAISPYSFPGRGKLQPALTRRRGGRVFLAGDYLGTLYTETAVRTGLDAAQDVRAVFSIASRPSLRAVDAVAAGQ